MEKTYYVPFTVRGSVKVDAPNVEEAKRLVFEEVSDEQLHKELDMATLEIDETWIGICQIHGSQFPHDKLIHPQEFLPTKKA